MTYIKDWFHNIESQANMEWKKTITVTGECRRHTGPSIWFAYLEVEFSPGSQFNIYTNRLKPEIERLVQERDWLEYMVFGFLDVMLTTAPIPIYNFKATINQIGFNEIESNQMAFRLAARNAASKALDLYFQASKGRSD